MKLNVTGLIATLTVSACLLSLPLQAAAHPLAISNQTTHALSFSANNVCLEDFGTIHEKEIKTISANRLNKACAAYASTCEIMGYNGRDCTGRAVGGIKYLNKHSFEIISTDSRMSITGTESSLHYAGPVDHK